MNHRRSLHQRRTLLKTLAVPVGAFGGTLAGMLAAGRAAYAQAWPAHPIRLLVGFAPGGGTDIIARAMAPRLGELLGQQVVIENKAGASGTIGAEMTVKSPPDGYTLMMGHSIPNAIAPSVLARMPYDASTDFTAITYIGFVPNVLVVHPSIEARSVPELIALAKSKPGVLTYASSGIGSSQHLAGALFTKITGTKMLHIPYKGSGQAIGDLLAGQVNMNFDTMPPVLPHIQSGKLRALAISTRERMPQLANVPTFSEVGINGFDVTNWYAIVGPKGMSRELVTRIDEAVRKTLDDPSVKPKLEPQGVIYGGARTPDEFAAFIKAEIAKYARLTRELEIRAE